MSAVELLFGEFLLLKETKNWKKP